MYQSPKIEIQKFNNSDVINTSSNYTNTFPNYLSGTEKILMNKLVYENDKENIKRRFNHYNIYKDKVFCKLYKNQVIITDSNGRYCIMNNELKEYFNHCNDLFTPTATIHSRVSETLKELEGENKNE